MFKDDTTIRILALFLTLLPVIHPDGSNDLVLLSNTHTHDRLLTDRKVNIPDHVRRVLEDPRAPRREAENDERTHRIRGRAVAAAADAVAGIGFMGSADDTWWRSPLPQSEGGREVWGRSSHVVAVQN